jgi:polyhydroxyalkanoate synthesis repressor PhaR
MSANSLCQPAARRQVSVGGRWDAAAGPGAARRPFLVADQACQLVGPGRVCKRGLSGLSVLLRGFCATKRWPARDKNAYSALINQVRTRARVMAKSEEPVTIKKYANRRLYNTGTSTYVTLEDLASLVKSGEDFLVYDAKTGEDITRSVLAQIIFEQENKEGQNLLPINVLRQLIRFYGDSMQMLVPRFLEASIESLTREQEKFRQQMAQAFGGGFGPLEDQVRRNMEMFQRAFSMFPGFSAATSAASPPSEGEKNQRPSGEIDDLKRQLSEMQKRLDRLTDGDKDKS